MINCGPRAGMPGFQRARQIRTILAGIPGALGISGVFRTYLLRAALNTRTNVNLLLCTTTLLMTFQP